MILTRDQLKTVAVVLASQFDTMPDDLWAETVEVMAADIEVSCVVGAKRVALMIRDAEPDEEQE